MDVGGLGGAIANLYNYMSIFFDPQLNKIYALGKKITTEAHDDEDRLRFYRHVNFYTGSGGNLKTLIDNAPSKEIQALFKI